MKKTLFIAMAALVCMSCAAKKPIKKQAEPQKSATELEIERLKQEKELRALKAELEADSIKQAQQKELDQIKHEAKVSALNMQKTLEKGMKMLLIPCMEEALALENSAQMAAQGIATDKANKESALLDANRVALAEITTRFLGVLKNGVEQYSKDTYGKSGNRGQEAQLEGLAMAVGEKAIQELFKVGCREIGKNVKGNYDCYEALYVPTQEVIEKVLDAAEEAEIDIDKAVFRNRMQAELDSQAAKQEAINQQKLEQIKAAKAEVGLE